MKAAAVFALEAQMRSRPSSADVVYLEIGDRTPGDDVTYPDDDIKAEQVEKDRYRFTRKDGTPF